MTTHTVAQPMLLDTVGAVMAWLRDSGCTLVNAQLESDSRRILPAGYGAGVAVSASVQAVKTVFVGVHATERDAQYAVQALRDGAVAALVDAQVWDASQFEWGDAEGARSAPRIARVTNLKQCAGELAAAFYEQPSQRIKVCAFTGTNGKTSSAWWLAQALEKAAELDETYAPLACSVIGTLGVGATQSIQYNGYTTPEPVLLQKTLRGMCAESQPPFGVCALEASSIGIAEHRLAGTDIHTAIFTNFSQDHLDYHGDMDGYWQAKAQLFAWPDLRAAVVNLDEDKAGAVLDVCAQHAQNNERERKSDLDVWTFSLADESARVYARNVLTTRSGLSFDVVEGVHAQHVQVPVVGMHNISNLLGVLATMRSLGVSFPVAAKAVGQISAVPGRMDTVHASGAAVEAPLAIVDFAHTPDALKKALQALRPMCERREGKLWCVVGCGGNRDSSKRPLMAAIAEAESDTLVLTSDNPRYEEPVAIMSDMVAGLHQPDDAYVEVDRAQAIAYAVQHAQPNDVILLAGKGHETFQEIQGQKHPFSDHTHAQAALDRRGEAIQ